MQISLLEYQKIKDQFSNCVKSVLIQNFFWSVFSCIRTEYGPKTFRIWPLFTQCQTKWHDSNILAIRKRRYVFYKKPVFKTVSTGVSGKQRKFKDLKKCLLSEYKKLIFLLPLDLQVTLFVIAEIPYQIHTHINLCCHDDDFLLTRSSRSQMFLKIVVLKKFPNFTGKHLCWSLFFNKVERPNASQV